MGSLSEVNEGWPALLAHSPAFARVEYLVDPVLIDTPVPRFFWVPQHADRGQNQSAYHIVVLNSAATSVWDSGSVSSGASAQVEYAGSALTSDSCYSWTVSWADNTGAWAPASAPATFCTGLFTQAEWVSDWITCPQASGGLAEACCGRRDGGHARTLHASAQSVPRARRSTSCVPR